MRANYNISGMTCQNCVQRVRETLESHQHIISAEVQLESPQAKINFDKNVGLEELNTLLGKYEISSINTESTNVENVPTPSVQAYKPLILIISFILGTTLLAQYPFQSFDDMLWMRHFMAGFFIVFAFFKFLNLKGFLESYSMYDVIAGKWKGWGYVYPFVELALGILYLTNLLPTLTNVLTIIILGISSIGVIQSNLQKRKIKCACLGDVFNLPMSTVTIVEDISMVLMAAIMLIL